MANEKDYLPSDIMNVLPSVFQEGVYIHQDHCFRHARELEKSTHGGYLNGEIEIPSNQSIVELSTIPIECADKLIHPNLLHVTIMNKSTKKVIWKSKLNQESWKIRIRVNENQAFLIVNENGNIFEKPIDCLKGNSIILGDSGLMITIITPLQGNERGNSKGIRIHDVIRDRLKNENHFHAMGLENCQNIVNYYTKRRKENPTGRIEIHRCRIKASFYDVNGYFISSKNSGNIINFRHKDVGAFELHDMSDPRSSCHLGGFKVILSLEFKIPTLKRTDTDLSIKALFVVEKNGFFYDATEIYPSFNQISYDKEKFRIHQNTVTFEVPPQSWDVINEMKSKGDEIKIALYRSHDNKFSSKKFTFTYFQHVFSQCHFCAIKELTNPVQLNKQKFLVRKRKQSESDDGLPNSPESSISSGSETQYLTNNELKKTRFISEADFNEQIFATPSHQMSPNSITNESISGETSPNASASEMIMQYWNASSSNNVLQEINSFDRTLQMDTLENNAANPINLQDNFNENVFGIELINNDIINNALHETGITDEISMFLDKTDNCCVDKESLDLAPLDSEFFDDIDNDSDEDLQSNSKINQINLLSSKPDNCNSKEKMDLETLSDEFVRDVQMNCAMRKPFKESCIEEIIPLVKNIEINSPKEESKKKQNLFSKSFLVFMQMMVNLFILMLAYYFYN